MSSVTPTSTTGDGRIRDLSERVGRFMETDHRSLKMVRLREAGVYAVLLACGIFSLLITLAIVVVLGRETLKFFAFDEVTLSNFFGSTTWNPLLGGTKSYGIWALISGTMLVTVIAMAIALPLGFGYRDLPERVCSQEGSQYPEADVGSTRRRANGGLWFLCLDDDYADSALVPQRV